jgi:transmembrane sensor
MTNKEKAKELLEKYLLGEANAEEHKLIDKWYYSFKTQTPHDQTTRDELEREIFQEIAAHIHAAKNKPVLQLVSYLKYAAVILLISALGIAMWAWSKNNQSRNEFAVAATLTGQSKKIMLTDGSVILLSPLSKVKYPLRFTSGKRTVQLLEGQAFFDIHHETQRPFRVLLPNGLYTHVLGTSFTISAFQQSERIEVAVHSGKVAVGDDKKVLGILVKGELLLYHKSTGLTMVKQAPKPVRELSFSGSSMLEVIRELENAYGIKIGLQAGAKLEKLKFTGTFTTNQPPEKVLWLLSRIHHFQTDASADKRTFKISKN